jgi:xylulokinase
VRGVGITVQRETFVLLDERFEAIRPAILWHDSRATRELAALKREFGAHRYHTRTGKQLDITSAAAKMRWLRSHEPANVKRAAYFADVLAYLSHALTGRFTTTWAGVDTTGLVSLRTRGGTGRGSMRRGWPCR